jgi:hypothetical protein
MRFDVPVIGLATIQAMRVAGATALSIDAGKTLVLDGEHVLASANDASIAIVGRPPRGPVPPEPLRLAVIGVGHLGRHHARILSAMPEVRLRAVVDTNESGPRRSRRVRLDRADRLSGSLGRSTGSSSRCRPSSMPRSRCRSSTGHAGAGREADVANAG